MHACCGAIFRFLFFFSIGNLFAALEKKMSMIRTRQKLRKSYSTWIEMISITIKSAHILLVKIYMHEWRNRDTYFRYINKHYKIYSKYIIIGCCYFLISKIKNALLYSMFLSLIAKTSILTIMVILITRDKHSNTLMLK